MVASRAHGTKCYIVIIVWSKRSLAELVRIVLLKFWVQLSVEANF